MAKDKLNDENFGTRDKRGNWKPFGTIAIKKSVFVKCFTPTIMYRRLKV